jgi:hypothetical protein
MNIKWLTLFKELIPVCCEKHVKAVTTNAALLIANENGTYSYRSALKVN